MQDTKYDIGVIVGRFQIHQLTEGHQQLIQSVLEQHNKVIIFLGIAPVLLSKRNPLDFVTRKLMIEKEYEGKVTIHPIADVGNNKTWSEELDRRIREIFPFGTVLLHGSRDSFVPHYTGHFPTQIFEQKVFVSGTEVRKEVSQSIKSSPDFRAGVIYANSNRWDISYTTVDAFIWNPDTEEFLMAKKPKENSFRFVGGFTDPDDANLESAVIREVREETGLEIVVKPKYLGSFRINDWRYASETDKIMTALFECQYSGGLPVPADDISELRWLNLSETDESEINPAHRQLFKTVTNLKFTKNVD